MSDDLLDDADLVLAEPSCASDYSSRCQPFLIFGGWYCVRCGEVPRREFNRAAPGSP